ncbi:MAG TPA: hypothetical protein PKA41_04625, partial [Verrucomicrobiota bacterium]|nr:hypothetical protein [Verrucomicrobiota bacterium]
MRSQLKICLIAVFLGFLDQSASGAEAAAQNLLEQSEAALVRSRVFKITYRASQEHIASVPELGMAGVLFFQSGNRFYLTNVGSFFGVDSQVECVADGTNYLAVVSPNKIRWERNSIQPDFNKSLIRRFLLAGVTPIVASEIMTGFPLGGNPNSQPLPYLTGPFSASEAKLIGDQTVEGRASLHIEMIFSMGAGEPVKTDLWLDKNTLFPVKRVTHDKSSGDVTEMYTLVLSPAIPGDTFSPQRVIQSRKLEPTIRQM